MRRSIARTQTETIVLAISENLDSIRRWGEARDWAGNDPYDALNSPLAPYLTLGTASGAAP